MEQPGGQVLAIVPPIVQREIPAHRLSASLPSLLQDIYAARGVTQDSDLDLSLGQLLPYHDLLHIQSAVVRCYQALKQQQRVLIIGDYDADGATGCALAVRLFRLMGLCQVDYITPNRFEYGYGLSPAIAEVAIQKQPDLIMTVDNGISSIEGVAKVRDSGIDVLITDHHLATDHLPDANIILNPNQTGDCFPSKCLAGVGVVFYLFIALRAYLREQQWFKRRQIDEPNLADYLDIVALGTVADVVALDKNNRILVHQGLLRLRAGRANRGIQALLEVTGRRLIHLKAMDLGYFVAPLINAAGRLDNISIGVECLLSDDMSKAKQLATRLHHLNQERRQISHSMQVDAQHILKKLACPDNDLAAYCFYDRTWHQGVVGILAGRIKDQLHRPVVVFADDGQGGLRGSARSIPGFHIRDAFSALAANQADLIDKFGGHAMAAGLSLKADRLADFRQAFCAYADQQLTASQRQIKYLSDGKLDVDELNIDYAYQLEQASPWGAGFAEPRFHGRFQVIKKIPVGQKHLRMKVLYEKHPFDAIAFNVDEKIWPKDQDDVWFFYEIAINRYQDMPSLQIIVHKMFLATAK